MAPRTTRIRRPANREPTSLISVTTTSEAIDTVEALNANIDPALQNYEIDHPPPPTYKANDPTPSSQSLDRLDSDYDDSHHPGTYEYPPPSPPTLFESREITWSPTPPPPILPRVSLSPSLSLPPISDIQYEGGPLQWSFKMEEILFHTLLDQVDNGKRAENGFKSDAWTACCQAIINAKITKQLPTVDKCKSKAEAMKALWKELNWLKDQSGFGWDSEAGLVLADDYVWKEVIKVSLLSLS